MPLIRASWLLALALGIGTAAARGQSPESPRPDGRRLRSAVDTFATFFVIGRDTARIGMAVDRLTFVGDRLIRVYTSVDSAVGAFADTIVSRADDFTPLTNHAYSRSTAIVIAFTDGHARGWRRTLETDSVPVDAALPPGTYDGSDFDLLVRALDLKTDTRVSWNGFSVAKGTLSTLEGRITGTAEVLGRSCWVFEGRNEGQPVRFWIDHATRDMVQLAFAIGSSGEAWVVLRTAR